MINISLKWQAPEYHSYERSVDWFWAVGIITLCIVILSFVYNNSLFGILILLSAIILVYFVKREPEMVTYEITQRGVLINDEFHPYQTLESFWLELQMGEPKLILKSKKTLQQLIMIPIEKNNPDEIHGLLSDYLTEAILTEPASHKVMEYLGF